MEKKKWANAHSSKPADDFGDNYHIDGSIAREIMRPSQDLAMAPVT
jgi:hypothetical protein